VSAFADEDVPSSIDLRSAADARAWAEAADLKRPWRSRFRAAIVDLLHGAARVLELGPGPGLLAEALLDAHDVERYTLFDFSPPMLEMCRARLAGRAAVHFVLGDFTQPDWPEALAPPSAPPFDAVIAMQAVHEVRHKRHVARLYAGVRGLLRPGGLLVVCDHEPMDDSPRQQALHSTVEEQHAAFGAAGFVGVATHLFEHGLYVCSGRRPAL
jgi:SAM-dependent methyltransferase